MDNSNNRYVVMNTQERQINVGIYPASTFVSTASVGEIVFIGQEYDSASALSYLNARYYDGAKAKFISQDPVFWEVGQTNDGKAVLANPQAMNSYSYANGNPIVNKDPDGRVAGIDDLAIVTAPAWLPYALVGAGALYAGTVVALRNNGLRFIPDAIRTVQAPNKWLRWGVGGTLASGIAAWGYDVYQNITSKGPDNQNSDTQGQSQQIVGPQSAQSTPASVSSPKGVTYVCGVNISACSAPQQPQQIKPANNRKRSMNNGKVNFMSFCHQRVIWH